MSVEFSESHMASVRVWMKCFTLPRRSVSFLIRSRYFAISSSSMRTGCLVRSCVMVWRSGMASGVSVSRASCSCPSWMRRSLQKVLIWCFPLCTPLPPYSSPEITTVWQFCGVGMLPMSFLICGSLLCLVA